MRPPELAALRELAEFCGVKTSYAAPSGKTEWASEAALLGVLGALGIPLNNPADARGELERQKARSWRQAIAPTLVAWDGAAPAVELALPQAAANGRGEWRWRLESGDQLAGDIHFKRCPIRAEKRLDGERRVKIRVHWRKRVPSGYHRLSFETSAGRHEAWIISAPRKFFSLPGERRWGLFLPVYALRSARDWGAGDLRDWRTLMETARRFGATVGATLPLLPIFLEQLFDPSPYAPVSRLFWNEFYAAIDDAPELAGCPNAREWLRSAELAGALRPLRNAVQVDYRAVMRAKRQALARLMESARRRPFWRAQWDEFIRKNPRVADYARFRAVAEARGEPWWQWPERMRLGELRAEEGAPGAERFYSYAQWLISRQMRELSDWARGRGQALFLDLPLGVNRAGYDAWRERESFALQASGGAPPDLVFTKGQDWGFPPLHPERIRENGYAYAREYLRRHLECAQILRLDHVMSLRRLYWIPAGNEARDGAYVRYAADEWHAILSLESHRAKAALVGENLGVVPPEVNQRLRRHGYKGMYILQYELRPDRERPATRPPAECAAGINTHDMPPFLAFWRGLDLLERKRLGLLKRSLTQAREEREKLLRCWTRFLRGKGWIDSPHAGAAEVLAASWRWLSASPAALVLLNGEDLWLETRWQNLPGTGVECPNWRGKCAVTLEAIARDPGIERLLRQIQRWREKAV